MDIRRKEMNQSFENQIIERLKRIQPNLLREPLQHALCLSSRCSFLLSRLSQCMYYVGSLYRLIVLGSFLSAFAAPLCVAQSVPRPYLLAYAQISKIKPTNTQSTNSICAIITPITNLFLKRCKLVNGYGNY